METTDKSGKVKVTFEIELNQPIMELVRQDIDMMMDIAAQGADIIRKNMGERRKGHGMGMMIHGHE
jgi:guanylate kinase